MPSLTRGAAQESERLPPWVLGLGVANAVLWTDLLAKDWAVGALTEPVPVTPWFYLALHGNAGLFLGALPAANVRALYWLVVVGGAGWLLWRIARGSDRTTAVGYALVFGGLAGNALSRLQGPVVDFLAFGPVTGDKWLFANLADLFLVAGALVLGVVLVRGRLSRFLKRAEGAATSLMAVFVAIIAVGGAAFISNHVWLVDQRDTLKEATNAASIAAMQEMRRALADDPGIGDDDLRAALEPVARAYVLVNLLHLSKDRYDRAVESLVVEVRPDRGRGTVEVSAQTDLGGFL